MDENTPTPNAQRYLNSIEADRDSPPVPRFPDLKISLQGVEANTFGIIDRVVRVIADLRSHAAAEEFKNEAWAAVRATSRIEDRLERKLGRGRAVNLATAHTAERVAREWVVIGDLD